MKRITALLLILLMLTGCGIQDLFPTQPPEEQPTEPTEPERSWVEEFGEPWDEEGVLLEVPLTIPGGWYYTSVTEFDGDLLLWNVDSHLEDVSYVELCIIELDDGTVSAQRDVACQAYATPQVMGKSIYLCDSYGGKILQLNKELKTTREWETEPGNGLWYMGGNDTVYQYTEDSKFWMQTLPGGKWVPVLEGDPEIWSVGVQDDTALIQYYHPATGEEKFAALDLNNGAIHEPDLGVPCESASYVAGNWLCHKYTTEYTYYLQEAGEGTMLISQESGNLELLEEGYLLSTPYDGEYLRLYDLDGRIISSCQISETADSSAMNFIWNEELDGYFFQCFNYSGSSRLLFWDISQGTGGNDLTLHAIPEPSEAEAQLQQRADDLSEKYGVSILIGEECDLYYYDFEASMVNDWSRVTAALDVLEDALEEYPPGFMEQLRYGSYQSIEIQLVCDLIATGSGRSGDGYAAFVSDEWDHHLMVVDIDDTYVDTYYHEFSHIIDSFLEWDSWEREDALYSEEGWADLNPGWFDGYSHDYGVMQELEDYTSFVDSYSTISPTEDRARVLEYAMSDYGQWTFEDAEVLTAKLDYYADCIRDAFDTTGWPNEVHWEQYLD